jgi:hypothetical protein
MLSPVTLVVTPPSEEGEYILVLDHLRALNGGELDGMDGRGEIGGIHRRDEDGISAPAPYISLPFYRGDPPSLYFSHPSFPYLKVEGITALYTRGGSGLRDQDPEPLYRDGESRVSALPPYRDSVTLRIEFSSPAGFPFSLPSPLSLRGEIVLLREDGSEIPTRVDLSADPQVEWILPQPFRVRGVSGRVITLDTGPNQPLGNFRPPPEEVYLLIGDLPPPRGILLRLLTYDPATFSITVTGDPLYLSGEIRGWSFLSSDRFLLGSIREGMSLAISSSTFPVTRVEGRTIFLGGVTAPPQGPCSRCPFLWEDLSRAVELGSPVYLTATRWYLHLKFPPAPSLVPLYLVINDGGKIRNIMGAPFRDEERDGNEKVTPPSPEDRFVLKLSFRPIRNKPLTASRVNDGRFYPTAFTSLSLPCVGDQSLSVCVFSFPDPFCPPLLVTGGARLTFATADGDGNNPFGFQDLVNLQSLKPGTLSLKDQTGNDLAISVNTRTLFVPSPYGIFPTTMLEIRSLARTPEGCLRPFAPGDILRIDHRIAFELPDEPKTLDGDGDGVASPDPEDDWIGIYNGELRSFITLPRHPSRPP